MRIVTLLMVAALLVLPVASEAAEVVLIASAWTNAVPCGSGHLMITMAAAAPPAYFVIGSEQGCQGVSHPVSGTVTVGSRILLTLNITRMTWSDPNQVFWMPPDLPSPVTVFISLDSTLHGTYTDSAGRTGTAVLVP